MPLEQVTPKRGDEEASAASAALTIMHGIWGDGAFTAMDFVKAMTLEMHSEALAEALGELVGKRLNKPTAHSIGKLFQKRLVDRHAWIGDGEAVATLKKSVGHNANTYRIHITASGEEQKHPPHSPHSPNRDPGESEMGNEGTAAMSAIQALGAARALGIHLELDGDDLLLEASGPPPDAVLAALSRHKPEVVRLLHSAKDGSSPEYWHVLFHQRVAFAEFAGGLPRAEAEAQAFECCVVEWLWGAVKVKPMALSSCLTEPSPGPTLGYMLNAGRRGMSFVDLRRERLSLESVSAVWRTPDV